MTNTTYTTRTADMVCVFRGKRRYEFPNATVWNAMDTTNPLHGSIVGAADSVLVIRDAAGRMLAADTREVIGYDTDGNRVDVAA